MRAYLPHYSCLLGDSWLIASLMLGHLLTFYAYIAIPIVYWKAGRKYMSTQHPMVKPIYRWMPAFIFCCALTHGLYIATLFWGGYWYVAAAIMVVLTGVVSAYTAWAVVPLLPKYLAAREEHEATISNLINKMKSDSTMKEDWKELGGILAKLDSIGEH